MFEINVTGVFMTAQAVAKHMIKSGNGGSIVMIGSMSGTVANRVRSLSNFVFHTSLFLLSTPLTFLR
jgi:NAD(P)-dependent dehydrogenase (short-subunit alcohol dehydrogenase family)